MAYWNVLIRPERRPALRAPAAVLLLRLSEVLLDHVAIGLEPISGLDELTAFDGPDLKPSAAFMVFRRHLHRRRHTTKGKVLHLFHAVLHVFGRRPPALLGLDSVAKRLDMHGRPHNTAIVVDRRVDLLGCGLTLRLVHLGNLPDDWKILADTRELESVVALGHGKSARGTHVGFGGAPHQRDDLAQRIALALEFLDGHRGSAAEKMRDEEIGFE